MTAQPNDTVIRGPWGPGPLAWRRNRLDRPADDALTRLAYPWRVWRIDQEPSHVSTSVSTYDLVDGGFAPAAEPTVASAEEADLAPATPFGVRPRIGDVAA